MTHVGRFREWWEYIALFGITCLFFSTPFRLCFFFDLFTVPSRRRGARVAEYTVVSPSPLSPAPSPKPRLSESQPSFLR